MNIQQNAALYSMLSIASGSDAGQILRQSWRSQNVLLYESSLLLHIKYFASLDFQRLTFLGSSEMTHAFMDWQRKSHVQWLYR